MNDSFRTEGAITAPTAETAVVIKPPHIVSPALKFFSDDFILCAPRHSGNIMTAIIKKMPEREEEYAFGDFIEGFVDQYDKFYDREEAYVVAEANGQIKYPTIGSRSLTSLNLY